MVSSPTRRIGIRRLATVLVADAVGFSRRMGENEQAAMAALLECRELMSEAVEAHGGRTIGMPGDFLLALMPSGSEAVQCAIHIQGKLAERNHAVDEAHRAEYRVGIGVGDIYESGGDVLGDAVNIASRLQAIAAPGGIVVSGAVRDIVGSGEGFAFEYLGDQNLKNLVMPVRAYGVVSPGEGSESGQQRRVLLFVRAPVRPVVEIEEYRATGGAEDEKLFAEAFTEELITILVSLTNSLVVRRVGSAEGAPAASATRDAPRLYRLKGSVRHAGDKVRIMANLIVHGSGEAIWGERFDYKISESFDAQELIAREVVTALQVTLTEGDQAQFWHKGTTNLRAWELFQRGHDLERRFTRQGHRQAREAYLTALEHDPRYISALVAYAFCHLDEIRLGWTGDIERSYTEAAEYYRKASSIELDDPQCHALLAYLELHRRNDEQAVAAMEKAVRLAPRSGELAAYLGYIYDTVGRYDDAIEAYYRAMHLSIHYPAWIATNLGFTLCVSGRLAEAQRMLLGVTKSQPDYSRAYLGLAVTYRRLGLMADAMQAASEVRRLDALFPVETWAQARPYADRTVMDALVADLRAVGLG
jgi:adenylate cyclase